MNQIDFIATELIARKQTLTCAEACTGGLLGGALTSSEHSHQFFERGFLVYSDTAKRQILNVGSETLRQYGSISEEVVREMALGALIASRNDLALAILGVASETEANEKSPLGLMWFGLATKQRIWAKQHTFTGTRQAIRTQAVDYALGILEYYLKSVKK